MNRLDGKIAFLSGAARGIGGATAKRMVEAGAKVAIGDVLDETGRKLAQEIGALYVHLDVTQEASWAEAMDATVKHYGKLDVLVNNAGIFVGKGIEDASLDLDALERVMRASLPPGIEPELHRAHLSSRDFRAGRAHIQLTEWPEFGSLERGRIAPDGWLEPMFESMVANAGHY